MNKFALVTLSLVAVTFLSTPAGAHRSGCHRWHTCPSDTGSYTMADPPLNVPTTASPRSSSGQTTLSSSKASTSEVVYTNTDVNLRENAASESKKLALLPKGEMVVVYSCANKWCNVYAKKQIGYIIATSIGR